MAQFVSPPDLGQVSLGSSGFQGVPRIFEYTNWDGEFVPYNCGQAAAATFLTFQGRLEASEEQARTILCAIEADHPPDNFGGYFGTSRRRVERICRCHGVDLDAIHGEEELRQILTTGTPAIVMLGVPGPKFLGYTMPAGHWMVAYGFDETSIYLTNQGSMDWPTFRTGWNSLVPRLISMRNRALVARNRLSNDTELGQVLI